MSIGLVAAIGGASVLLVGISLFNKVIGRKNQVENAFGSVDAMLKKRFDLIPGLVATVKQYASHEQETLTRLTALRARAVDRGAPGQDDAVALDKELSQTLGRLMVAVESYPALKANEGFQQLQRSLNEIEEQLSASRRAFNAAVTDYNDAVEMFPTNFIAGAMGLRRKPVFQLQEAERANPDVAGLFKA